MNDLRQASAGEVWTLRYRENDHDPWIYLILSLDHNGVNMFTLHANGYSQSRMIHEPYEDVLLNELIWTKLSG